MQLNSFTDYSLRVLIYAAAQPDQRCLTAEVATTFDVSRHHIVKVVNELRHLGYLETVRGRTGGFRLAKAPEQIRIGDVVRGAEGTLALVECFDAETNTCPLARACGLKGALPRRALPCRVNNNNSLKSNSYLIPRHALTGAARAVCITVLRKKIIRHCVQ